MTDSENEVRARLREHQAPASITDNERVEANLRVAEAYLEAWRRVKEDTDRMFTGAEERLLRAATEYAEMTGETSTS